MFSMKNVVIRVDVDTPTDSLILNKLKLTSRYLSYLFNVFDLSREYGIKMTFMFRVPYTLPPDDIVQNIKEIDGEVALHSEGYSENEIIREKRLLEARTGEVFGVSYHGCDLDDHILYKLTGNRRIILASGTPFHSMLAGFKYHACGYCEKPTYLKFGDRSIMVFPGSLTLDHAPIEEVKEFLEKESLPVLMFHPNYLKPYGFRKPTLPAIRQIFHYINKMDYETKTFKDMYLQLVDCGNVEMV